MTTPKAGTDKPTPGTEAGKQQEQGAEQAGNGTIVPLEEMLGLSAAVTKFDRMLEVSPDAVVTSATTALNAAVVARDVIKSQSEDRGDEEQIDDAGFIGNMLAAMLRGKGAGDVDNLMCQRYEGLSDKGREAFAATLERSKVLAERLGHNTTSFQQLAAKNA